MNTPEPIRLGPSSAPATWRVARAIARRAMFADAATQLGRWAAIGAALGCALVLADKLAAGRLSELAPWWAWLASPVALGAAVGIAIAVLRRWSPLRAAARADESLGLHSRLASAVEWTRPSPVYGSAAPRLPPSPFTRWAIEQAEHAAASVDPKKVVPIRPPWTLAAAPALALSGVLLALAMPALERDPGRGLEPARVREARERTAQQIEEIARAVQPPAPADQPDAAHARPEQIEALEALQRELAAGRGDPEQARLQAARQLQTLADNIEQEALDRQQSLDAVRRLLAEAAAQSPDPARPAAAPGGVAPGDDPGAPDPAQADGSPADLPAPASDLIEALRRGDLAGAADAMRRLDDAATRLSPEERQSVADALDQLAQRAQPPEPAQPPAPPSPTTLPTPPSPPSPTQPPPTQPPPTQPPPTQPPPTQPPPPQPLPEPTEPPTAPPKAEPSTPPPTPPTSQPPQTPPPSPQPQRENGQPQQNQPQQGQPRPGESPPGQPQNAQPPQGDRQQGEQQPGQPQQQPQQGDPQQGQPQQQQAPSPTATPAERIRQALRQAAEELRQPQPTPQPQPPQPQPPQNQPPDATPQPQPGEPQPQPGAQPTPQPGAQPAPQAQEPGQQVDPSALGRAARELERLSDQPADAQQRQQQAERLRELARRLQHQTTPEQQQDIQRLVEQLREPPTDAQGLAGRGTPRGVRPPLPDAAPAPEFTGDTRPVDARPRLQTDRPRERVIAEWYTDAPAPRDRGAIETRPAPAPEFRQAAEAAQRAVEQQAVPMRYADVVRRVFQRYSRQFAPPDVPPDAPAGP